MKLEIVIQNGSLAGRKWEMTGEFLTVGRSSACDIIFDPLGEREVSSKHAYIEHKPDGYYLVDNDSTNGTFVNGEKIKRSRLKSRDVLKFGNNGPEALVLLEDGNGFQNQQNQQHFQNQFQSPVVSPQQFQQFQPNVQNPQVNLINSITNLGMVGAAQVKPAGARSSKHIVAAVIIWILVFLSLPIVTLLILGNLGIAAAVISAVVAFVPAMFYVMPLMFIDRYDPEPLWLLAMAFAWGALVSVLFSALTNDFVGALFGQTASGVISAPIFEEGSKGLGVLLILICFRREFDDILDGIVYAGVIALGFATVENVLYYGRELLQHGSDGLIGLFIVRGILSPFAHVTFTSMTGIGCGISRESHNTFVRLAMPILGYCCAVALHAFWNGMVFLGGGEVFILGYIALEVPFFFIFIGFSLYIMYRQNKILKEMLAIDAALGLITQEQLKISTSVFKSLMWLGGSVFSGKYRARKRFLRSVGKLGLSHWHIQRATIAKGQTGSFEQNPILRDEVLKWREQI